MRTKGEALINKVEDCIIKTQSLICISYTEDTYSELVKAIGGEIEKFIKSDILNLSNKIFYDLIEELKNFGITQIHIDYLHDFRLCYNGYKHDPNYSKTIFEVKTIFENLKSSLEEINTNNLGNVGLPYQNKSKRVVWFAGWDYYIGGMVECNIFIPDYSIDMPIGIEHFNIEWRAWEIIINKFTNSNELFMGKENVSDKAYEFWKAQSDFLGAGAFIGDVSEFVRELSKNIAKNESELIPFLKRNHDSFSVNCSIIFALYDSIRANTWINCQSLKDEILLRMTYDYGVDLESPYIENINHLDLENIERYREQLKHTNDILWLDETYQSKTIGTISKKLQIGYDNDFNILTKINNYG
jgi:hypothetical protein